MLLERNKPSKPASVWNPFQKMETEMEAEVAARSGAFVAGYLVFSYAIQTGAILLTGRDLAGHRGMPVLIVEGLALLFAVFLFWRITVRQPRWAAIVAALWYFVELAVKIASIITGRRGGPGFYFLLYFALIVLAIMGVRGSFKLSAFRRRQAPEEVFD